MALGGPRRRDDREDALSQEVDHEQQGQGEHQSSQHREGNQANRIPKTPRSATGYQFRTSTAFMRRSSKTGYTWS
jgi:hypothetical protein